MFRTEREHSISGLATLGVGRYMSEYCPEFDDAICAGVEHVTSQWLLRIAGYVDERA
jgi:hypothetical protein